MINFGCYATWFLLCKPVFDTLFVCLLVVGALGFPFCFLVAIVFPVGAQWVPCAFCWGGRFAGVGKINLCWSSIFVGRLPLVFVPLPWVGKSFGKRGSGY